MHLRSPDGEEIPRKYTQDGEDVSPPLEWDDVPPATKITIVGTYQRQKAA